MSKYATYTNDQFEEHFANFLIDSWSYSRVSLFSRNEKEFERNEIYREKSRRSASSVAGNAYHRALEQYFNDFSRGIKTPLIELENVAFSYIDDILPNWWKIQKTTPTIEDCRIAATKTVSALLKNFVTEVDIYMSDIVAVLSVEQRYTEWLTINGVDLPLPCHAAIDLVTKLKDGKVVIIDHKSVTTFADDKELAFTTGKQAITYVKCYEAKHDVKVDEVWFIENKHSTNKTGGPQLRKFKVILTHDTRRLYEAILYEPLKRMIEAVSNPNYVYLINDRDNMCDTAELYEFWAKTMIAEVDDFEIPANKKELISRRLKKIRDTSLAAVSPKTIAQFRKNAAAFITYDFNYKDMTTNEKIEHILRSFGVIVQTAHFINGYSSDTYLLEVSAGVKIASVGKYALDIANALDVASVRIGKTLTVHEGKSYLSVEVTKKRVIDLNFDPKYLVGERIPIGVDNYGKTVVWDLANHATPHMLICGATGSGKSVCIKSTIEYAKLAGISDVVIFDPKYEFVGMKGKGVRVYNDILEIENQMAALVKDMEGRVKNPTAKKTLVIFDEFADAVANSRTGKALERKEMVKTGFYAPKKGCAAQPKFELKVVEVLKSLEENLRILLQKGRSLGFRIVAATQRASVKVITGDAKVNFPVQVCFRVPKEVDSKVVLDEGGAEALAGLGDGLMKSPEYMDVVRFQGFFKAA